MSRSASLIPRILTVLCAALLLGLLALGFYGQQQTEKTRVELAPQTAVAQQLVNLHRSATSEGNTQVAEAATQALKTLAPAARDLEPSEPQLPLEQQLEHSADALVTLGLEAATVDDRSRALTPLTQIWSAAQESQLTEAPYPQALETALDAARSVSCQQSQIPEVQPLETLGALQESLHALHYTATHYAARAQQGYKHLEPRVRQLAEDSQALQELTTPALACAGHLQGASASYPTVEPTQAEEQLKTLTQNLRTNALAALSDSQLPTGQQNLEAITLALALQPNER